MLLNYFYNTKKKKLYILTKCINKKMAKDVAFSL